MEKILITGGFGFIGKNLIEKLESKYEIIVIDKYIDEKFLENNSNLKFYSYDFLNDKKIAEILESEKPDFVINLISIVSAERNMEIFYDMIKVNFEILIKLYEALKGKEYLKLFINFGSGEEYGNISAPYSENDREEPNSPYSITKQLASNTSIMLSKNYGFPISVVRPGNLFGKYQNNSKFIPYIINKLLKNEEIETTLCEQKRDFIYVEDFVNGIEEILINYKAFKGEIVNISSGVSISLKEIIEYCKTKLKSTSNINYGSVPYRENEMMNFNLSMKKFNEKIGKKFSADVFEGLDNYMQYIKGEK